MKTRHLKRNLIAAMLVPATMGLIAGPALAAGAEHPSAATRHRAGAEGQAATMHAATDIRASKLVGKEVINAQGENLGEIHDLVIDVNNDRVHYAILAFGGIAGLGEKLFAYPIKTFSQDTRSDKLVLNVDKERLDRAPGFARNNWPDWNKDKYRGNVDRYFGPTVTIKQMPNEQLVRASTLLGRDVEDTAGRDAGEIEDLVVNLGNGKVHYAVLDVDEGVGKGDILVPMSLRTFKFPADSDRDLVLTIPRNKIDTGAGFKEDAWPDFNAPGYERDIDRRLRGAS